MAEDTTQKKNILQRIRSFLHHSRRIFKIAHKPTRKEYWLMMKICLVGFLILGVLSFIIHQIIVVVDPVMLTSGA
jgi:protein translocase SEC61 complex gamma subunit